MIVLHFEHHQWADVDTYAEREGFPHTERWHQVAEAEHGVARRQVLIFVSHVGPGRIEAALARANGVISQAAADLGLSRQALYRRIEKLGINGETLGQKVQGL